MATLIEVMEALSSDPVSTDFKLEMAYASFKFDYFGMSQLQ